MQWSPETHARSSAPCRCRVIAVLVAARRVLCPLSRLPLELLFEVIGWCNPIVRDYSVPLPTGWVKLPGHPCAVAVTSAGKIIATVESKNGQWLCVVRADLTVLRTVALTWVPGGVAVDGDDSLLVIDRTNNRIVTMREDGTELSSFATSGFICAPQGVAVALDGSLVVTDWANNRVQVLTREGITLRVFGADTSRNFSYPFSVAVGSDGSILVGEEGDNHRVQWLRADGTRLLLFKAKEGPGKLFQPRGVAFDRAGNVVVADCAMVKGRVPQHERVVVFRPDGSVLWQYGSRGTAKGFFHRPNGVAIAMDDRIVVADYFNRRLQLV